MNLEQLRQVEGSCIKECTGTILKLWPRKSGVGKDGTGTMQNGSLRLESGDTINITFWHCEDMSMIVDKRCTFRSKEGEKGIHGVKVSSFKEKLQLEVTSSAEIEQFSTPAPAANRAPTPPPSRVTSSATPAPSNGRYTIKELMGLYNACASEVWETATNEEKANMDHIRNIATSLFIAAKQEGIRA